MRTRTFLVSVLLAATLSLFGVPRHIPGITQSYPDPIPNATLVSMRSSIAAIDQFLSDGDISSLWQTLDACGHGLDPWPDVDDSQRDLAALAFRATHPNLHLTIGRIAPENGLYDVELLASGPSGPLPLWYGPLVGPPAFETTMLLDNSSGQLVRASAMASSNPLQLDEPAPGAAFPVKNKISLDVARLTLKPAAKGDVDLTIAAPALITPISDPMQVSGRGELFRLRPGDRQWVRLGSERATEIGPSELLYLANGFASLALPAASPVSLIYATSGMVTGGVMIDEDGRPLPTHLTSGYADSPMATWFGSIDSLTRTTFTTPAERATFQMEWIVLPLDTSAVLDPRLQTVIALDLNDPAFVLAPGSGDERVITAGNTPRVLLVIAVVTVRPR